MEPTTKAGRRLAHEQYTRPGALAWTPEDFVDRILLIESEALPSLDLLARAIEETDDQASARSSRLHAEAILEWLREQG